MWPSRSQAVDSTLAAEAAVADMYSEALARWLPDVAASVLPMVADEPVIPDPGALAAMQTDWDTLAEGLVLPMLSLVWSAACLDAMAQLDINDDAPSNVDRSAGDDAVMSAAWRHLEIGGNEYGSIQADIAARPDLAQLREDYLGHMRQLVGTAPRLVREQVELAMAADELTAGLGEMARSRIVGMRNRVKRVLQPAAGEMLNISRRLAWQAAGAMNAGVEAAAQRLRKPPPDPQLEKVWIATLDNRTRDTHWAADGQRAPLGGTFTVGGVQMQRPGDPSAPIREVANCRCRLGIAFEGEKLPKRRPDMNEVEKREKRGVARTAAAQPERDTMDVDETEQGYRTFTDAVVALIGTNTSDNRRLAADINLSFRQFPQPLMWMRTTGSGQGGHTEAFTVGVIEDARVEDGRVLASGYMLNSGEADEACELVRHGVTGPSVDLGGVEWMITDDQGAEISEEQWLEMPMDAAVFQTITAAELIGTTLVPKPAFGGTMLSLNDARESREVAVVASAADRFRPRVFPAQFFANPNLSEPTRSTMDDDGRIFGHLACFGSCHRSIQTECVMAPRSPSSYQHFHTSPSIRLDDGSRLAVGRLTVDTGHAPDNLRGGPAAAHYDNTGTCWALVRVGEDSHGIWFSGVAAPWATAEQIERGLQSPLSGDWRDFGQGLELVAALSVNTPGFAARGRDDEQGRPVTLVASLAPTANRDEAPTPAQIAAAVENAVEVALAGREHTANVESLLAAASAKVGRPPTPAEDIAAMLAGRP